MKRLIAVGLIAWLCLAALPALAAPAGPDVGCRECHKDIASPMPPQAEPHKRLACTYCHLGDGEAGEAAKGHQGMAANPSALDQAKRACGSCHKGWPEKVALSPMATNLGLINQTRHLWGEQSQASPEYGAHDQWPLVELPGPGRGGKPVDDFLRRRCLRCHLWGKGADSDGARRSAGCAACHRVYGPDNQKPKGHALTKKVPVSQCLTCHGGGCGAGAEYAGRTARDARDSARFLATDRARPKFIQDRVWRPMRPDAHFKAGMACIDCHPRSEIMGDGRLGGSGLEHVGVRCYSCHGTPGKKPDARPVTSLGALKVNLAWKGKELMLTGKLDGKARAVPLLPGGKKAPVAHRISQHAKVACHACHASYNPGAWGMQVMLETRMSYGVWSPIAAQGDPQAFKLLCPPLVCGSSESPWVQTADYLSGKKRPGLWVVSPWFRRLLWRVYGVGPEGRTYLLNPRFQYVVTLMNQQGKITQQARVPKPGLGITPWNPHTIARPTVGCADCHGSAKALGLGLTFTREGKPKPGESPLAPGLWQPWAEGLDLKGDWTRVVNLKGEAQQEFLVEGSRPYSQEELKRLLEPGKNYNRWLLKALEESWPFRPAKSKE
ncbi:MAG: cytochrome c3 family protein [Desulfarculaceae bacterium]|nr:cytochrome c3 family protein [Desulfarculaceae bacterium]